MREDMKTAPCTQASHDVIRAEPRLWSAETRHLGYQRDIAGAPALELATCRACGSTLARLVPGVVLDEVAA
jgi:hypothetical protein